MIQRKAIKKTLWSEAQFAPGKRKFLPDPDFKTLTMWQFHVDGSAYIFNIIYTWQKFKIIWTIVSYKGKLFRKVSADWPFHYWVSLHQGAWNMTWAGDQYVNLHNTPPQEIFRYLQIKNLVYPGNEIILLPSNMNANWEHMTAQSHIRGHQYNRVCLNFGRTDLTSPHIHSIMGRRPGKCPRSLHIFPCVTHRAG